MLYRVLEKCFTGLSYSGVDVSTMLISNTEKKENSPICEATSESTKVTFMVCDEAMEAKFVDLRDDDLWRKHSGQHCCAVERQRNL